MHSLQFPSLDFEDLLDNRPDYYSDSVSYYATLSLLTQHSRDLETIKSVYHNFDAAHNLKPVVQLEDVLSKNLATTLSTVKSPAAIVSIIVIQVVNHLWMILGIYCVSKYAWFYYKQGKKNKSQAAIANTAV